VPNLSRARLTGLALLSLAAAATLAACTSVSANDAGQRPAAQQDSSLATTSSATGSSATGSSAGSSTPVGPSTSIAPKSSVAPKSAAAAHIKVHASLFEGDGLTYGVGMPVIMRFDGRVTSAAAFEKAVKVELNGRPATGAWYFEPAQAPGATLEAHYRQSGYWPAHSRITVDAPLKGVSAGAGRAFDDNLTLSMNIGAAMISTVDASASNPHMIVREDGKVVKTFKASLGKPSTPTYRGVKIVEEFDRVEDMEGTPVAWSVRLTNSGEFVHAAPWNGDIGSENLSHGCTNLHTADAKWFFTHSHLGDVVLYPNAPGQKMNVGDGFGDWNLTWAQWQAGGLV
jgi:lipoprotein-anchoring transpeptidase ErfK/SrfK